MLREQIIKARKEQGYTQGSLAEKIGVRQATISEFESGKRSLGSDILEKIITTLDLNIMTTIEEKKMQLELSAKIAAKLISSGLKGIETLTQEDVWKMSGEDYILKLENLSDEDYKKAEKKDLDYKTWNMFFTLLKFDFVYQLRKSQLPDTAKAGGEKN